MAPFTIRPAAIEDVPAILSLIRELAAFEKLESACVASEELLRTHLFGNAPAARALVATRDDAVVGYAIYFLTFSTFLARPGIYLEDLYVQPAHRHHGIGTAVFRHLAALAIAQNYGRIEWSVLTWNTPAITFYERLGAKPLAEWSMMRLTEDAFPSLAGI